MTSIINNNEIETKYGYIIFKDNDVIYDSNDGRKSRVTLKSRIKKYLLLGDYPMYLVFICEDGNVMVIEFPSMTETIIQTTTSTEIIDLIKIPSNDGCGVFLVDANGGVMAYDHLY